MGCKQTGYHVAPVTRRMVLAAVSLACLIPTIALAHHGWSEYGAETFALEGTAREVRLGNPHEMVRIEDRQGRVWDTVLGPPARNRAAGLIEGAMDPGDTVRASGRRHRDPSRLEMKTGRLEARGRSFDIYPDRLSQRAPPAAR